MLELALAEADDVESLVEGLERSEGKKGDESDVMLVGRSVSGVGRDGPIGNAAPLPYPRGSLAQSDRTIGSPGTRARGRRELPKRIRARVGTIGESLDCPFAGLQLVPRAARRSRARCPRAIRAIRK